MIEFVENITPLDQMHEKIFPRDSYLRQGFRPQHLKASDILHYSKEAEHIDVSLFLRCLVYIKQTLYFPHPKIEERLKNNAEEIFARYALKNTGRVIREFYNEEYVAKLLCGIVTGRISGFSEEEKKHACNVGLEEILEINHHDHTLSAVDVARIDTLFIEGKSLEEVVLKLKNGFVFSNA